MIPKTSGGSFIIEYRPNNKNKVGRPAQEVAIKFKNYKGGSDDKILDLWSGQFNDMVSCKVASAYTTKIPSIERKPCTCRSERSDSCCKVIASGTYEVGGSVTGKEKTSGSNPVKMMTDDGNEGVYIITAFKVDPVACSPGLVELQVK